MATSFAQTYPEFARLMRACPGSTPADFTIVSDADGELRWLDSDHDLEPDYTDADDRADTTWTRRQPELPTHPYDPSCTCDDCEIPF